MDVVDALVKVGPAITAMVAIVVVVQAALGAL